MGLRPPNQKHDEQDDENENDHPWNHNGCAEHVPSPPSSLALIHHSHLVTSHTWLLQARSWSTSPGTRWVGLRPPVDRAQAKLDSGPTDLSRPKAPTPRTPDHAQIGRAHV